MTYKEFCESTVTETEPPDTLALPLKALWFDRVGDWAQAHQIAQDSESDEAAWVHAYLHRKEGDLSNARYWYRRSGKQEFIGDLDDEWDLLVRSLLD